MASGFVRVEDAETPLLAATAFLPPSLLDVDSPEFISFVSPLRVLMSPGSVDQIRSLGKRWSLTMARVLDTSFYRAQNGTVGPTDQRNTASTLSLLKDIALRRIGPFTGRVPPTPGSNIMMRSTKRVCRCHADTMNPFLRRRWDQRDTSYNDFWL